MAKSKNSRQATEAFIKSLVDAGREYAVEAIDRMHSELFHLNRLWRSEEIPFSVRGEWEGNKIGYIVSVSDRWKHDVMQIQITPLSSKEAQVLSVLDNEESVSPRNRKRKEYGDLDTGHGIQELFAHIRMEIMDAIPAGHQEHVVAIFNGVSPKDPEEFADFHSMYETIKGKFAGDSAAYLKTVPEIKPEI